MECSAVSFQVVSLPTPSARQVSGSFCLEGRNISLERVTAVENQEPDERPPPNHRASIWYIRFQGPRWFGSTQRNDKPWPAESSGHNYISGTPPRRQAAALAPGGHGAPARSRPAPRNTVRRCHRRPHPVRLGDTPSVLLPHKGRLAPNCTSPTVTEGSCPLTLCRAPRPKPQDAKRTKEGAGRYSRIQHGS